jgi:hypothetical protein
MRELYTKSTPARVLYNPCDVTDLFTQIHPVDRVATTLWFLWCDRWTPSMGLDGSHRFLYGHRYWPRVKSAIVSATLTGDLEDDALIVSESATRTVRVDRDQLLGITAVGLKLRDLVGAAAFAAAPGRVMLEDRVRVETPSQVIERRAATRPEGLLGRFQGDSRRWRITTEPDAADVRIVTHGEPMGPCRGGNHEACLVGILAGADRLSPVAGDDPFPMLRRVCDARVFGRVSWTYLPPLSAASSRSI